MRRILKAAGILLGIIVLVVVIMGEVLMFRRMADDYRASIVRETVVALSQQSDPMGCLLPSTGSKQ